MYNILSTQYTYSYLCQSWLLMSGNIAIISFHDYIDEYLEEGPGRSHQLVWLIGAYHNY